MSCPKSNISQKYKLGKDEAEKEVLYLIRKDSKPRDVYLELLYLC